MRTLLKTLKKQLDDKERAVKATLAANVADEVKALCQANPTMPMLVKELQADSNTKVRPSFSEVYLVLFTPTY